MHRTILTLALAAAVAPATPQNVASIPYREVACTLRWGQMPAAALDAACSLYLVGDLLVIGADVADYPATTTLRGDLSFGAVIDRPAAWGVLTAVQIFQLEAGPVVLSQPVGDLAALRPGPLVDWPGGHRIELPARP